VERTRPAPPTAEAELSSPPKGRRSLSTLIDEVRAPGANQIDVDALLRGLARPLGPEQSPRERADLLLALIEDPQLSDLAGSNDRTVRGASIQALMALGYPYALEVPPEALGFKDSSQRQAPESLLSTSKGKWGFGLVVAMGVLMMIPALILAVEVKSVQTLLVTLAFSAGSTFLPAGLTVWGHNLESKLLKGLGSLWLLAVGMLSLVPAAFMLGASHMTALFALIPLAISGVFFTSIWLMNSKS
jgi:hypothetical protein